MKRLFLIAALFSGVMHVDNAFGSNNGYSLTESELNGFMKEFNVKYNTNIETFLTKFNNGKFKDKDKIVGTYEPIINHLQEVTEAHQNLKNYLKKFIVQEDPVPAVVVQEEPAAVVVQEEPAAAPVEDTPTQKKSQKRVRSTPEIDIVSDSSSDYSESDIVEKIQTNKKKKTKYRTRKSSSSVRQNASSVAPVPVSVSQHENITNVEERNQQPENMEHEDKRRDLGNGTWYGNAYQNVRNHPVLSGTVAFCIIRSEKIVTFIETLAKWLLGL